MYIVDFEKIQELLTIPNSDTAEKLIEEIVDEKGKKTVKTTTTEGPVTTQINTVKYDVFMNLLTVVLNAPMEGESMDLGVDHALDKADIEVQIAFRTLEHYGILKEI